MNQMNAITKKKTERGAALLLVMFAIILVSGFGILMYFSSGTESRIDANYGSSLNAYYAARFGLEEVRARVKYSTLNPPQPGITLPLDIAGNASGVLYVLNPANGENVDPTDVNNRYFDDQLCHDFNSGVPRGTKCTVTPTVGNWNMQSLLSVAGAGVATPYKWVRVNMKTNRISDPYFVDATNLPATLDSRVCWDGTNEQLSPGGANPACDANGMQTVYMLTSLAVTPGVTQTAGRKLLRSELVAPSIRPPGAVTMDAASAAPILSGDGGIPTTAIDGRVHTMFGVLGDPNTNRCSAVAAVATDNQQTSTQIAQQLDALRQSIVNAANGACNPDGSPIGTAACSAGLWWVRGTDLAPRYSINPVGGAPVPTPTPTPVPTPTPLPTPTPIDDDGGHHHGGSSGGPGTSGTTGTTGTSGTTGTTGTSGTTGTTGTAGATGPLTGGITPQCDPGIASCYANLDLTAPELLAVSATMAPHVPSVVLPANPSSPFTGGSGNSMDPAIYQTGLPNTLPNQVKTLSGLVSLSVGQANYIATSVANLAPSYGSPANPVIVVIQNTALPANDPGLQLASSLTGFGVLVVPNDFEINNAQLQWTGVVLVQGGAAKFVVGAGATGWINGSLMLQPTLGTAAVIQTSTSRTSSFRIAYSCDAIDMAFSSLPFKVISSSESSF